MRGWLVVNGFWQSAKFETLYGMLADAAARAGVALERLTNAQLLMDMTAGRLLARRERPDFVLFWDKDVRLARGLERMGLRLYNKARAIETCDDKSLTHLALAGVAPMPRTILAPHTFAHNGYPDPSFVRAAGEALGYPLIVKECFGSFGQQVYLARDEGEAVRCLLAAQCRPVIFQQFIRESAGRDVRVQVAGGRVVAAMRREGANGDFRANLTNGGRMHAHTPTVSEREIALRACAALDLDFGGVDLLFGREGPLLCEVNSNAHFKNLYDLTGVNAADAIFAHIKESACKSA